MTVERAVSLLGSSDEDTLLCAAGHLQTQCLRSADAKKSVRSESHSRYNPLKAVKSEATQTRRNPGSRSKTGRGGVLLGFGAPISLLLMAQPEGFHQSSALCPGLFPPGD